MIGRAREGKRKRDTGREDRPVQELFGCQGIVYGATVANIALDVRRGLAQFGKHGLDGPMVGRAPTDEQHSAAITDHLARDGLTDRPSAASNHDVSLLLCRFVHVSSSLWGLGVTVRRCEG
jgi:hypothetical protein